MRSGVLCIVMLASLAAAPSWAARKTAPKAAPKAVPKLIQSCDAHKFETVVGESKVKLCGVEGQSDAEWIDTLRDAIKKLEANKDMPAAQRDQIVAAIKSEIARLTIMGAGPVLPRKGSATAATPVAPLSRDYATLPPLPPARETSAAPAPIQRDFADLPPMPAPLPPAAATAPIRALIPAVAPRLKFGCDTPGDLSSDAPCAEFDRETTLTVHAGEDVPAGTLLQFVRNDRAQADVPLGGLRRGGAVRVALPANVCRGFTSGKLELRIAREDANGVPQPLSTDGPYSLRC